MSNAAELRDANPWHPITRPIDLKHLGKLNEELGEASAAVFAYLHPDGGDVERDALQNEIADVEANIRLVAEHFDLAGCVVLGPMPLLVGSQARLLSFGRKLGVAAAAVSRCTIQGIDECEPVSGKLNREWLHEALADVINDVPPLVVSLDLNRDAMDLRRARKMAHLRQWHGMPEAAE